MGANSDRAKVATSSIVRLISVPSPKGRDSSAPPCYITSTSMGVTKPGATSENAQKAKFAEFLFWELPCNACCDRANSYAVVVNKWP